MEDNNNYNNNNYRKEKKLQKELQEEFIRINGKNLKKALNQYEDFTKKLLQSYFNKRLLLIKTKNLSED